MKNSSCKEKKLSSLASLTSIRGYNIPSSYSRKLIQLAIVEVDVFLERIKMWVIHRADHNINCIHHQLFMLSMWVDRRMLANK